VEFRIGRTDDVGLLEVEQVAVRSVDEEVPPIVVFHKHRRRRVLEDGLESALCPDELGLTPCPFRHIPRRDDDRDDLTGFVGDRPEQSLDSIWQPLASWHL
jgi:hypothetical protein